METHWFVVMSQRSAKIYSELPRVNGHKKLKLLKALKNPLGLLKRRDLVKRQAGQGVKTLGRTGAAHYSEPQRSDPQEDSAIQFAREIARFLTQEKQQKHFDKLTLVAEPKFLGKVKAEMEPGLQKTVNEWVKKDLEKTPQSHLPEFLLSEFNL